MKAKCWRVEQNALALDLLDHRPLGENLLQRLAIRQPAMIEFQPAQLCERVVLILQGCLDPILGAQVAHEDGNDECVGLIAGHLGEPGGAGVRDVFVLEMPEILHLEQAA